MKNSATLYSRYYSWFFSCNNIFFCNFIICILLRKERIDYLSLHIDEEIMHLCNFIESWLGLSGKAILLLHPYDYYVLCVLSMQIISDTQRLITILLYIIYNLLLITLLIT